MGASISVTGLSKRYLLGERVKYKTLRESLTGGVRRAVGLDPRTERQELWALRDVDVEVQRGDVLGLVGRNGAGKSTLLKILARITEPTAGRVVLEGRVGSMLEVGTGFHPELTGRENVFLNGAILGMRKTEIARKFDQIVAFAELEDFLDTPVKRYSSGMYVRLAFAVAAHLEPEILLVDEVLAVGDAAFQKKCLGLMGDVAQEGRTVLFVSHDMGAVQQLTRTALWLDGGRIAAAGATGDVVQKYLSSLQDRAGTVCDLADAQRPFSQLGRTVELERIELEDLPTPILPADGDLTLLVTVSGKEDVARFRLGLTVSRIDGVAVGNVFTAEELSVGRGETATYRLRMGDLRLAPGTYSFAIAAGTGDARSERREFDVVRDVLVFQALGGGDRTGDTDGILGEWHPAWGSIRFEAPRVERAD